MSATSPDASFAGEIYRMVERHRRELLRMERAGATEMIRAYGQIWQRLKGDIERLIKEYREAGGTEGVEWLFQYQRLDALQRQVEAEIRRFAAAAEQQIIEEQREAVTAAEQHVDEIMRLSAGARVSMEWKRLPVEAVTDLVGFTRDGSPLRELLDELGPEASKAVRDGLIQGVALGKGPRAVARQIRSALGGNLTRALTISRTETMRSYREATRRNYQENKESIAGWRWLCAKNQRTCPACLAMDGTFHKLSERLDDHPNGRCVAVPALRGQESQPAPWETGDAWLAKQDEETQRRVLGQAGAEAYRAGQVQLADFVGRKQSRKWGSMRYTRSVRDVLAEAKAAAPKPPTMADQLRVGRELRERITEELAPLMHEKEQAERELASLNRLYEATTSAADRLDLVDREWQITSERAEIERQAGKRVHEAMSLPENRRASFDLRIKGRPPKVVEQSIHIAQEFLQQIWGTSETSNLPIELYYENTVGRAYAKEPYRGRYGTEYLGEIHLYWGQGADTIVHELGHQMTYDSRRQADLVRAFWEYRTHGETPRPLSELLDLGYSDKEIAYKDRFVHPYMGRIYPGEDVGGELISMGMQYLYTNPLALITEDPEYFDFLVTFLWG